jgi:hypothetical protein
MASTDRFPARLNSRAVCAPSPVRARLDPHQCILDIFVFQAERRRSESEDFVLEFRGGGRPTEHLAQTCLLLLPVVGNPEDR